MNYDQWKDQTDYSPDPPEICSACGCSECASKAAEIYIGAAEKARGLEAEVARLKRVIAGATIRVISPRDPAYCGDGFNVGYEIVWPAEAFTKEEDRDPY